MTTFKRRLLAVLPILLSTMMSAQAVIINTSPNLTVISAPSVTVQADWIWTNELPQKLIFAERQNVTLGSALGVDTGSAIAAGTVVSSYFLGLGTHDFATYPDGIAVADVSVTFDAAVLGIIYMSNLAFQASPNFAASDFLGALNTTYLESTCPPLGFGCAFEASNIPGYTDSASIMGNTALFHSQFFYPGDVARIIVASVSPGTTINPVPGPIVGAGIPGLVAACLGWAALVRRRKAVASFSANLLPPHASPPAPMGS